MIEIIPINLENDDYKYLSDGVNTNVSFVSSIKLITRLVSINEYPIKNKYIAINNILSFLSGMDILLNNKNKTTLPISTRKLIKYFNINKYKQYVDLLSEINIMTKVPYDDGVWYDYSKDISSKGRCLQYRFHNDYLNDDLCIVIFNTKSLPILKKDRDYNKKFENTILKTQINYREAIIDEIKNYNNNLTFINKKESIYKLRCKLSAIVQLTHKRYITKGNKVNRVYTSFCNLSRISRKHLHNKGVKFNFVDIKNCQPLLLCYYIISKYGVIDDNYLSSCQHGKFYETLFDSELIINMNEDQLEEYRSNIKVLTYKNIYFNLNKKEAITIKFASLYPNTYYYLCNYYESNIEETMASNLQNIEANIFNNIFPERSKYYYTLFDAIYFTDIMDIDIIYDKINMEFEKLNIIPKIKLN